MISVLLQRSDDEPDIIDFETFEQAIDCLMKNYERFKDVFLNTEKATMSILFNQ